MAMGYPEAMHASEKFIVLAFLGTMAVLYVSAGSILVRAAWDRLFGRRGRRQARAYRRGRTWLRRAVLAMAAAGLVCMAYGYFIEPRWLEVTRVRVESTRLRGSARPVRIVQISDIHCEACAGPEEGLPGIIEGLAPDVIVFTGDAVNTRGAVDRFHRCMSRLAAIAPTFAVRGNWDVDYFGDVNLFGGTGVRELSGQAVKLTVAGADVWFAGAAAHSETGIDAALAAAPAGACKVLLYHYPDPILEVAARGDVDLQLSGHTHGGQIALPFYGAMVTLSRHGKRFERGLYRVGRTSLYVSRGIGLEGGHAPPMRFCSRPEVTLIELAPPPAAGDRHLRPGQQLAGTPEPVPLSRSARSGGRFRTSPRRSPSVNCPGASGWGRSSTLRRAS